MKFSVVVAVLLVFTPLTLDKGEAAPASYKALSYHDLLRGLLMASLQQSPQEISSPQNKLVDVRKVGEGMWN